MSAAVCHHRVKADAEPDRYGYGPCADCGVLVPVASTQVERLDDDRQQAEDAEQQVNLPDSFWNARPSLLHIRQAAWSRCAPADAVLYATLARLASMIRHEVKLDTGVDRASHNLFVAVCGPSGAGKSTTLRVATDLIDVPTYLGPGDLGEVRYYDGIGVGSGEGVAEAYYGTITQDTGEVDKAGNPKTERVRQQVRHNVNIVVDEGESLTKMIERSGATIGPTLRTAWSGGTLGQANARIETTRIVPAGEYALGMTIGYQRDTAQALLGDVGPGTPQRFLWCYATDPDIPDEPPRHPGTLAVTLENGFTPITDDVTFVEPIRRELWQRKLARARGEVEDAELDSQEPVMRAKVAALLAILDGRWRVTRDDWDLAAVAWATSCNVRDDLIDQGRRAAKAERDRIAERVREDAVLTAAEVARVDQRVERIAQRLRDKVRDEGGMTRNAAKHALANKERKLFEVAVEKAAAEGWLRETPSGLLPSPWAV